MTNPANDAQTRILRTFTLLHTLRAGSQKPDWSGDLILNIGLDPAGEALSFAANIAGAVCLTLESNSTLLRNAQRSGSCDFIVNTLDEALRAMKNEIRKHRPLSVGLEGDPSSLLAEILERGLAPNLFTAPATYPEAATQLQSTGAILIDLHDPDSVLLQDFLAAHPYDLHTFAFATTTEIRNFDTRALNILPPADYLRRQWLVSAARILPRDRHRTLWLTPAELPLLAPGP